MFVKSGINIFYLLLRFIMTGISGAFSSITSGLSQAQSSLSAVNLLSNSIEGIGSFFSSPLTASTNIASGSTPSGTTGQYTTGNSQNPDTVNGTTASNRHEWNTPPYAVDLINYAPKHRFLFKVVIETTLNEYDKALFGLNHAEFQYVVKHIDKPTVSFDYEDLNYYNYHTKVLKMIKFEAISMTLTDDSQNKLHNFFKYFLEYNSPIARTYGGTQTMEQMKTGGFNFTPAGKSTFDSAIRGSLAKKSQGNMIKSIKIYQYFQFGSQANIFTFINPRILDFNFNELSHQGDELGNECAIRFDYDALSVSAANPVSGAVNDPAPGTDIFKNVGSGVGIVNMNQAGIPSGDTQSPSFFQSLVQGVQQINQVAHNVTNFAGGVSNTVNGLNSFINSNPLQNGSKLSNFTSSLQNPIITQSN